MESLPLEDAPPLRPRRRLWPMSLFAFACLLLALGTFGFMRYRGGSVPDFALRDFPAPDGTCKALLIGAPVESTPEFPPGFHMIRGGKQFTGSHWSTPVSAWLRWYEIDAEFASMLRSEDVIAAEVTRREKELNAKVEKEAAVKWNEFFGREVHYAEGRTRTVERYLFVNKASRPRLYVVGIGGSGLNPDSDAVRKVVGSFRLN